MQALAEKIEINQKLEQMSAIERIEWSLLNTPGEHVMSSSFGIQSAVLLHMTTQVNKDIPVLFVDTGYLFPETYLFVDELQTRLNLNVKTFHSNLSNSWQEARYGQLWAQGLEGLERYNNINKVEPMQRALAEHNVQTWFAGLRRDQATTRSNLDVLRIQDNRYKIHPIVDWSNRDVHKYLKKHDLPYHPLWDEGYMSIGDTHSSMPLIAGMSVEQTRFGGLKRECGLHD